MRWRHRHLGGDEGKHVLDGKRLLHDPAARRGKSSDLRMVKSTITAARESTAS
jgi:hypothetical protein